MATPTGLGEALRQARLAQGLTLEALGERLHWPAQLLDAVEEEAWHRVPPGQERAMVRQMAAALGLPVSEWAEAWAQLPGDAGEVPVDPREARIQRAMTWVLGFVLVGVLAWLVIPGPDLRTSRVQLQRPTAPAGSSQVPREQTNQAFPVVGEALPEAPLTADGILVTLRAMDVCKAVITREGERLEQVLRVSEPWRVRVKGPFSLNLENAGVVMVEVAGRAIPHGRGIGELWEGSFDAMGVWQAPPAPEPRPAAPPEPAEPEVE